MRSARRSRDPVGSSRGHVVGIVIELVLWFYILFLLARLRRGLGADVRALVGSPRGAVLVLLELIYSVDRPADPAVPAASSRRCGWAAMSLDLSVMFVLLICYVLHRGQPAEPLLTGLDADTGRQGARSNGRCRVALERQRAMTE